MAGTTAEQVEFKDGRFQVPGTNYAFGFFEHMPHTGNADRLTHTYVVYGGGLFPGRVDLGVGHPDLQKQHRLHMRMPSPPRCKRQADRPDRKFARTGPTGLV